MTFNFSAYEVPLEVTLRGLMLWLVQDSAEDEAHERERVRVIGHVDLRVAIVGQLERLPWTALPAYLEQHFELR